MNTGRPKSSPGSAPKTSRWSLWSEDSVLSIASRGSVLSIGSIGSVASIGSVGSALSIFSIGSWLSAGSVMCSMSRWSLMSHRSRRGVLAAVQHGRARTCAGPDYWAAVRTPTWLRSRLGCGQD